MKCGNICSTHKIVLCHKMYTAKKHIVPLEKLTRKKRRKLRKFSNFEKNTRECVFFLCHSCCILYYPHNFQPSFILEDRRPIQYRTLIYSSSFYFPTFHPRTQIHYPPTLSFPFLFYCSVNLFPFFKRKIFPSYFPFVSFYYVSLFVLFVSLKYPTPVFTFSEKKAKPFFFPLLLPFIFTLHLASETNNTHVVFPPRSSCRVSTCIFAPCTADKPKNCNIFPQTKGGASVPN